MAETVTREKAGKTAESAKKTAAKATDAAKKTAAKAVDTAKKTGKESPKKAEPAKKEEPKASTPAPKRSTVLLRVLAFVLWALAITCEVFAILALTGYFLPPMNLTLFLILAIVLDLVFAIIAAQLWKRTNRINPMSGKNKFLFYIWTELGVIMACICFIPLIIFLLKDKNLDKKTKTIVTIVAVVALLITGVASAEFNPITAEQKASAEEIFAGKEIYWSSFGHKYHVDSECQAIRNSSSYEKGEVTEAIEKGRGSLCAFCARDLVKAAAAVLDPDNATADQLQLLEHFKEHGYSAGDLTEIAQNLEKLKTDGEVANEVAEKGLEIVVPGASVVTTE